VSTPFIRPYLSVGFQTSTFAASLTQHASVLVENSVCEGSRLAYKLAWPRWRLFLHQVFELSAAPDTPDCTYVPRAISPHNMSMLLGMFCAWMVKVLTLSAARTLVMLTALRYHLTKRNGDVTQFDSAHLQAVRRGLRHMPALPDAPEHLGNRRVPVTLEIVMHIHELHMRRPDVLANLAHATAVVLAFSCLFRPSEYLWGTRSNTHVLTAGQFEFECYDPATIGYGETSLVTMANMRGVAWERVIQMRITIHTAKNINRRNGAKMWFSAVDASNLHLVRAMYDWAHAVQLDDKHPVFSWLPLPLIGPHYPGRRPTPAHRREYLWYKDMTASIKKAARFFGFDDKQFSCHGLRVGGATLLRAAGADDGYICLMGRWRSLPACLSYQEVTTHAHDQMAALLFTPGIYTSRDLRLQYSLPRFSSEGG
jgi:hypothetical protein